MCAQPCCADNVQCCGRYADTEICRNLSDECRYNMLPTIAEKLGYSTATNGTMWRDAALVALNEVRTGPQHIKGSKGRKVK